MIRRQSPLARLAPHPNGLIAALKVLNSFHGLMPTKEFSRTLFSDSKPCLTLKKKNHPLDGFLFFRAGKGFRTLDIDLGKVALYQLSYSRVVALI